MNKDLMILLVEAMSVYFCVLWTHSLKERAGLGPFYALLGGVTAIMSWVTDAGVKVEIAGITFMVGSTVFYTSLLLGVFVVYVFEGPRVTRIAILTVAGVSSLVPLVAASLHLQAQISGLPTLVQVPMPSLRINVASVLATVLDLIFLAMAWEYLGKPILRMHLWLRSFLTLLGVMWLDVVLFATGAFLGTSQYTSIMTGTLVSRLLISIFACPFLYLYLCWRNRKIGMGFENRPVLTILKELSEVRTELSLAQREIETRKKVEREKEALIQDLQRAISEIKVLRGFLPICAHCKKVRDDEGYWQQIESYIQQHSDAVFSHSVCPDCLRSLYPDFSKQGKD